MALGFGELIFVDVLTHSLNYFLNSSCKSNNERTKGCEEVSASVDHIQTSSVDVDRELSRIHALCVTHIDRFDSVLSEYFSHKNIIYFVIFLTFKCSVSFNKYIYNIINILPIEFVFAIAIVVKYS